MPNPPSIDNAKLDRIVAEARRNAEQRELGYRERALKMYPWICGRCAREFTRANLQELTVHHRNHDHDYNPPDGSNWELLCVYCHDNEHSRHIDHVRGGVMAVDDAPAATGNPVADLKAMMERGKKTSRHECVVGAADAAPTDAQVQSCCLTMRSLAACTPGRARTLRSRSGMASTRQASPSSRSAWALRLR